MKGLQLPIDIPAPSRYVSHGAVDEIANEVAIAWHQLSNSGQNIIVEDFINQVLEKDISWSPITEPKDRICFASIDIHGITLNENHRTLFESKPSLLRSCLSHEIGHEVLGHVSLLKNNLDQQDLFQNNALPDVIYHDSRWHQFGLTREEFALLRNELARRSFIEPENLEVLKVLNDKLEPDWMYYQAEQFAACLLIPKTCLFGHLERGIDFTQWRTLYTLAKIFEVSISMITVRLEKLNLIKIEGKQISAISNAIQDKFDFQS